MFNMYVKRRREFIVEEKDVTTVMAVINENRKFYDTRLGNCGWEEEPSKWFIMVDLNDKQYGEVIRKLNEMGTFKLDVRPRGQVDLCFERA